MTSARDDNSWKDQFADVADVYADIFPELSSPYSTPMRAVPEEDENKDTSNEAPGGRLLPALNVDAFMAHHDEDGNPIDSEAAPPEGSQPKRHYSVASTATLSSLQQLEAQFIAMVTRLREVSDGVAEKGGTRSALLHAKNTLAQICGDIDKFQFERIDGISSGDLLTGQVAVKARRKSLNGRCDRLRQTALDTVTAIAALLEKAPPDPPRGMDGIGSGSGLGLGEKTVAMSSTAVDDVQPDWSGVMGLQNKRVYAPLSDKYVHYMQQNRLPVANAMFVFLQEISVAAASSSEEPVRGAYGVGARHCLSFESYDFVMGELDAVLYFLTIQSPKLRDRLHELVIVNCGLNDNDCATIATHVEAFRQLDCISLKYNAITSVGAERLCVALMACETPIESLRFDHNLIDGQRMKRIAQMYLHCPSLLDLSFSYNPIGDMGLYFVAQAMMNPLRKAYATLPVPQAVLSGQGGMDIEASNLEEIEDIDTDDDSEPKTPVGPATTASPGQNKSHSFKLARRISMQQKRVNKTKKSKKIVIAMRNRIEAKWVELGTIGLGGGSLMEGADVNLSKGRIRKIFKRCVLKLKAIGLFLRVPVRGVDVTALRLEGCGLSAMAGPILKALLCDNTYISELYLSDNSLGDKGAKAICDIVKSPQGQLSVLELRHNGISEEGVKQLTQAAAHSAYLHSLDLSGCLMGSTAVNWVTAGTGKFFLDDFSLSCMDRSELAKQLDGFKKQEALLMADHVEPELGSLSGRRKSQTYNPNNI